MNLCVILVQGHADLLCIAPILVSMLPKRAPVLCQIILISKDATCFVSPSSNIPGETSLSFGVWLIIRFYFVASSQLKSITTHYDESVNKEETVVSALMGFHLWKAVVLPVRKTRSLDGCLGAWKEISVATCLLPPLVT